MKDQFTNMALNADSYKLSHYLQLPPGSNYLSSYIEARDRTFYPNAVFFGLQAWLKSYASVPVTHEDIEEAAAVAQVHGEPFNREGWMRVVNKHKGYLPLSIEALPEGTIVPVGVPMVQVVNTDPELAWLTSYVETQLLRAVWYPTTVCTQSHALRKLIGDELQRTADDPAGLLPFKLHDFGARGASSQETAALGGMAHLVNFMGTDTLAGILAARRWYREAMAGFSIPAAEHSTITSWKRSGESAAYLNMLKQFGGEGKMLAVVSDSYDIENAVANIWGKELREAVLATKGTLVIRPDSGDPVVLVPKIVAQLAKDFGATRNSKGFLVLNPAVRVIQGDGVNPLSIRSILGALAANGYSAENVAFGMGGALLQAVTRDTLGFAMKANAICTAQDGWYDVYKDPVTSSAKRSKRGVQAVVRRDGVLVSVRRQDLMSGEQNLLQTVWRDGQLLIDQTFAQVRERAAQA